MAAVNHVISTTAKVGYTASQRMTALGIADRDRCVGRTWTTEHDVPIRGPAGDIVHP